MNLPLRGSLIRVFFLTTGWRGWWRIAATTPALGVIFAMNIGRSDFVVIETVDFSHSVEACKATAFHWAPPRIATALVPPELLPPLAGGEGADSKLTDRFRKWIDRSLLVAMDSLRATLPDVGLSTAKACPKINYSFRKGFRDVHERAVYLSVPR